MTSKSLIPIVFFFTIFTQVCVLLVNSQFYAYSPVASPPSDWSSLLPLLTALPENTAPPVPLFSFDVFGTLYDPSDMLFSPNGSLHMSRKDVINSNQCCGGQCVQPCSLTTDSKPSLPAIIPFQHQSWDTGSYSFASKHRYFGNETLYIVESTISDSSQRQYTVSMILLPPSTVIFDYGQITNSSDDWDAQNIFSGIIGPTWVTTVEPISSHLSSSWPNRAIFPNNRLLVAPPSSRAPNSKLVMCSLGKMMCAPQTALRPASIDDSTAISLTLSVNSDLSCWGDHNSALLASLVPQPPAMSCKIGFYSTANPSGPPESITTVVASYDKLKSAFVCPITRNDLSVPLYLQQAAVIKELNVADTSLQRVFTWSFARSYAETVSSRSQLSISANNYAFVDLVNPLPPLLVADNGLCSSCSYLRYRLQPRNNPPVRLPWQYGHPLDLTYPQGYSIVNMSNYDYCSTDCNGLHRGSRVLDTCLVCYDPTSQTATSRNEWGMCTALSYWNNGMYNWMTPEEAEALRKENPIRSIPPAETQPTQKRHHVSDTFDVLNPLKYVLLAVTVAAIGFGIWILVEEHGRQRKRALRRQRRMEAANAAAIANAQSASNAAAAAASGAPAAANPNPAPPHPRRR